MSSHHPRTEAALAGALTCAISTMLSPTTLHQLQRVGVSEQHLQIFQTKFKSIQMSVDNVTNNSNSSNDLHFKRWLQKVNALIFHVENSIDEHDSEILRRKNRVFKKTSFSPLSFRKSRKISKIFPLLAELQKEARDLGLDLEEKDKWMNRSSSFLDRNNSSNHSRTSEFVGRRSDEDDIKNKLRSRNNFTIAIVGMAGIGKTTIADKIFKNEMIGHPFGKKFWVTVGVLDVARVLKAMLLSLEEETSNLTDFEDMLTKLFEAMKKERVLLVLDDVRSVNQEQFDNLLYHLQRDGAKISFLVTTRRIENARTIGASYTHHLPRLSGHDSWELFKINAFHGKSTVHELETVGRQIVQRCHGVPLVIRKMACLLQNKEIVSEWETVAKSELWDLPSFEILSTLSLTYDRLPEALKRCFAYCSIFPKNAIIRKCDLIRLWFAQGFLPEEAATSSVKTGERFFDILLNESLLQVCKQDEDGNVLYCIMHDLAHDLAKYYSSHEVLIINGQINRPSHQSDVRHLVISTRKMEEAGAISHPNRLRTIYSMGSILENTLYSTIKSLETLVSQARYLYVLKLDGIGLKEVPKNLGKLKFIRYLDLSNNPIKYVPESIIHLYLLQTLLLRNCEDLREVPEGLDNLTNLTLIDSSPFQLRNLVPSAALRIQPPIKLDEKEGSKKISELRDLTDIDGPLCISGLEYVDRVAAQEARVGKKHRLSALEFQWNRERRAPADSQHNRDEYVLEALQPHPNIKRLKLVNYDSQQFPTWVMRMNGEANERLYRLVRIDLVECKRCVQLPTMGQLPCLRELLIAGMHNIVNIGKELYKYADDSEKKDVLEVFFPALRRLILQDFSQLKEWLPAPTCEGMDMCRSFPRLETLQVVGCPNLINFPTSFPSLKSLLIEGITRSKWLETIIINCCRNHTLTSLILRRVSNINLPQEFFQCPSVEELSLQKCQNLSWRANAWNLTSLKELCIDDCSSLSCLPHADGLTALNTLVIRGCGRLNAAPRNLAMCKSLTKLAITNCSSLQTLPDLRQLTNLEELDILDCVQMRALPAGLQVLPNLRIMRVSVCDDFANFPNNESLERLWLKGRPGMKYLPHQPKYLSQLKVLRIKSFASLETVPSWICGLKELEILIFEECDKLSQLPPRKKMLQLKKLRCLRIEKCSILERSDLEWEKIGHVPHIKFKSCWHQGNRKLLLQGNPDIKAYLSSIDIESELAERVVGGPGADSDEEFYDFERDEPDDSIPERYSFCFYFMTICLLITVIISLRLYWMASKLH